LRLVFLVRALIDFPYENSPISASTECMGIFKGKINKCYIAKENMTNRNKKGIYLANR